LIFLTKFVKIIWAYYHKYFLISDMCMWSQLYIEDVVFSLHYHFNMLWEELLVDISEVLKYKQLMKDELLFWCMAKWTRNLDKKYWCGNGIHTQEISSSHACSRVERIQLTKLRIHVLLILNLNAIFWIMFYLGHFLNC
jgi:hypothetical protein